jgi:RNA recognition motif-containing protein
MAEDGGDSSQVAHKLFVGNVDYKVSEDILIKEISSAGRVISCTIPRDKVGRSRGYAIVEFESGEAADNAIKTLGNLEFNGRKITLRKERVKKEVKLKINRESPTRVTAEKSTRRVTRGKGKGLSPKRDGKKSSSSSVSGGSGNGSLSSNRRSNLGKTSSSSSTSNGGNTRNFESKKNKGRSRQLLRPQIKLDENLQGRLVYYGNLSWSADGSNISEFVGGNSCIIPTDRRGRSKGYALVEYNNNSDAQLAITRYNEIEFLGRRMIARLFVFKSSSGGADSGGSLSSSGREDSSASC